MKKTLLITLLLMLVCAFALWSCDKADTSSNDDNGQQTTEEADDNGEQTTDENDDNNNGGGENNGSSDTPAVCQHTFGDWTTVTEATCKEEGKRTKTCSKCSETVEESIQKSETHTPVTDAAVAATCKKTGLTEGSHCSVCDEVLVEQTTVPKTDDHTPVTDAAVAATCKKTGLTEGSHCSVCDKVLVKQTTVPKTENHTPVTDAAVPATCKKTGLTQGSHCSVCDKVLTEQKTVPTTYNHNFVPTQTYTSYKCSLCGLEVAEHGNADGSISGGNNNVKYYVTGDLENDRNYEIVVYGSGDMPDFSTHHYPMWYSYLHETVKVTIAPGITSIGAYTFYYPYPSANCNFVMSDTVKTIKTYAIHLNVKNLVLGNGVVTVENSGIGDINSIYIPKSVKYLYLDGFGGDTTYFYEGSLEEFYKIQLYSYPSTTIGAFIGMLDEYSISNIHIYVHAKSITDTSHYWR